MHEHHRQLCLIICAAGPARASFAILDNLVQARLMGLPYVYLGYWVRGSAKMDYKSRFRPLEVLKAGGWFRLEDMPAAEP